MQQRPMEAIAERRPAATADIVRDIYDRWAPVYDAIFWGPTLWARRSAVARVNAAGGKILEVGVGTGMALPLYRPGCEVTGIDISPEMMQRTADRVERNDLAAVAGLAVMDASTLAFPDGAFDAAIALHVISAVPDPDAVFAEMVRVTRPGGVIVVANHFRSERGFWAPIERAAERFTGHLGWNAALPIDRFLGHKGIRLRERIQTPPIGLYTLLHFERTAD
jgi:phosphatidylethanolamine/phosphatidyl-N-methylethanolamine N-methyltransferase